MATTLGLTNTLGATSLRQNLTVPNNLSCALHRVLPEDPSSRLNLNNDHCNLNPISPSNMKEGPRRDTSGFNTSGVNIVDMPGLNALAPSWAETKLTTSFELAQYSACVPRLGRIEPLVC